MNDDFKTNKCFEDLYEYLSIEDGKSNKEACAIMYRYLIDVISKTLNISDADPNVDFYDKGFIGTWDLFFKHTNNTTFIKHKQKG